MLHSNREMLRGSAAKLTLSAAINRFALIAPNSRIVISFAEAKGVIMLVALGQARYYRDLAEDHRRLAEIGTSIEIRNRYLRMAEHYGALAEAEEELALASADGN